MDLIEAKSEPEVSNSSAAVQVLPVSVIVPVRNEARNLPRCLESLAQFGEVYVIDSQSTDDTNAIAQSRGAKVVQFHYAGAGRRSANGPWTRCHSRTTGCCCSMRMNF